MTAPLLAVMASSDQVNTQGQPTGQRSSRDPAHLGEGQQARGGAGSQAQVRAARRPQSWGVSPGSLAPVWLPDDRVSLVKGKEVGAPRSKPQGRPHLSSPWATLLSRILLARAGNH